MSPCARSQRRPAANIYEASSANELESVFQNLPTYVVTTRQTTEITAFFTALAALLAILALALSFMWHPLS